MDINLYACAVINYKLNNCFPFIGQGKRHACICIYTRLAYTHTRVIQIVQIQVQLEDTTIYTTHISVDLAYHEIVHAKVGKGGINCGKARGLSPRTGGQPMV